MILIVLLALGLASGLIGLLSRSAQQTRAERRTAQALAEARDALVGFAALHGRLPRPAVSASDGGENPQACDSEQTCTGFLPWSTLGVTRSDAWGKLLRYSVTPVFTVAPLQASLAVATKTVRRRSGGALVYAAGGPICNVELQCVPAVIYSNGKHNFGTSEAGVRQSSPSLTNLDERSNDAASRDFIDRAMTAESADPGGEFDDQLSWIALPGLLSSMRAVGSLP